MNNTNNTTNNNDTNKEGKEETHTQSSADPIPNFPFITPYHHNTSTLPQSAPTVPYNHSTQAPMQQQESQSALSQQLTNKQESKIDQQDDYEQMRVWQSEYLQRESQLNTPSNIPRTHSTTPTIFSKNTPYQRPDMDIQRTTPTPSQAQSNASTTLDINKQKNTNKWKKIRNDTPAFFQGNSNNNSNNNTINSNENLNLMNRLVNMNNNNNSNINDNSTLPPQQIQFTSRSVTANPSPNPTPHSNKHEIKRLANIKEEQLLNLKLDPI